jgi:predicted membrane channel-forming protein YqfA (hemolysin III family)
MMCCLICIGIMGPVLYLYHVGGMAYVQTRPFQSLQRTPREFLASPIPTAQGAFWHLVLVSGAVVFIRSLDDVSVNHKHKAKL